MQMHTVSVELRLSLFVIVWMGYIRPRLYKVHTDRSQMNLLSFFMIAWTVHVWNTENVWAELKQVYLCMRLHTQMFISCVSML